MDDDEQADDDAGDARSGDAVIHTLSPWRNTVMNLAELAKYVETERGYYMTHLGSSSPHASEYQHRLAKLNILALAIACVRESVLPTNDMPSHIPADTVYNVAARIAAHISQQNGLPVPGPDYFKFSGWKVIPA